MLQGLAIENLLKALIAKNHGAGWDDRTFPDKLKTHDLGTLVDHTGIRLSVDDRLFVEELSAFVAWLGRYPSSIKPSDMRIGVLGRTEDLPIFARIFNTLHDALGLRPLGADE